MGLLVKYFIFSSLSLLHLAASSVIVNLPTTDFYQGLDYKVTWSWDGTGGSSDLDYQVLLVKADSDGDPTSLVYAHGDPGCYTWTVPTDLDLANLYYFGIWLTDEVYGSSANFTIHQHSAEAQPSTEIGDPVTASVALSATSALAGSPAATPTTNPTKLASSTLLSQSSPSANAALSGSTTPATSTPSATNAASPGIKVSKVPNPVLVGITAGAGSLLLLLAIGLALCLRSRRKHKREQSWRASGSTLGPWRHSFKSVLRPHHRASANITTVSPATTRSSNTLVPFSAEQYSHSLRDMLDPTSSVHELPAEQEKGSPLQVQE